MWPDMKPPETPTEPEPTNFALTYQPAPPAPSYADLAEQVKAIIASQKATLRELKTLRRLVGPRFVWSENLQAYITVEG